MKETGKHDPVMTTHTTMVEGLSTASEPVLHALNGEQSSSRPPSPTRAATTIHNLSTGPGHTARHSKKLSLSLPILVPTGGAPSPHKSSASLSVASQSPTNVFPYHHHTGTPISVLPLPAAEQRDHRGSASESPDFLTLIASQERKVMELKEELQKAESELTTLKKQWASFEAKKKHAEIRSKTVRMGPISPKSSVDLDAADRVRRREMREAKLREMNRVDGDLARSNSTKRNGQRVFEGRHTRTLSLLQNIPETTTHAQLAGEQKPALAATERPIGTGIQKEDVESSTEPPNSIEAPSRPTISRQPTLQDLLASTAIITSPVNLGKTYKELADAGRKTLPQGTDEVLKHGKHVYQGVSQGFWNFVEDIRQATVGDEATSSQETPKVIRKRKSKREIAFGADGQVCEKHGKGSKRKDVHKKEKDNFWSEFGLDTPKSTASTTTSTAKQEKDSTRTIRERDHESKSSTDSTDSKHPPSLLSDLMDVNEDDEAWENWPASSPVTTRQRRTDATEAEEVMMMRNSMDSDAHTEDSTGKEYRKASNRPEVRWAELTT